MNRFSIALAPELVTAFASGQVSVAFHAGRTHGPVFVTRERDSTYPVRLLRFRRIGENRPFREFPCPDHKVAEYLRNFLFMTDD